MTKLEALSLLETELPWLKTNNPCSCQLSEALKIAMEALNKNIQEENEFPDKCSLEHCKNN